MKQKLLFIGCLMVSLSWAKPKEKITANPEIGILVAGFANGSNQFTYSISIKNTGEETLTNIYVTDYLNQNTQLSFNPIASLAPGEEITNLQAYKTALSPCFDECQLQVHATTTANVEITDLSSDPNGHDNNGLPGTYYNDMSTFSTFYYSVVSFQEGIYNDTNGNNIIDVGDLINYYYTVNNDYASGQIVDNNAIIANSYYTSTPFSTTGIHYLTQAEVDLGYVYNTSYVFSNGCAGGSTLQDVSYCACPNPVGANIITALTTELPNRISGKVKFNTNNDNCATGSNFQNQRVSTFDGTYTYASYTNAIGDYHILIANVGNYTTNALTNLSNNFSSNPASVAISSSGSGVDYNNTNFCIGSSNNYADLGVTMFNINQAVPGNVATYGIYFRNNGSTVLNGSIQVSYDNGKLTLASANPTQNSTTANTITWNYINLLPFETRYINLSLNVLTQPTVNTGDLLPFTINGTPTLGDNVPSNNSLTWNQTVKSSFDPNDKTVIEGATISIAQASNYLTYVTRFQNTGTANASTVVIKENLDPRLDWNTFEPIASSHDSNIQIKNGYVVTYTFPNINLAYASANEPASHGWMAYRIKPKSTVVVNDIISSSSNIYFDYNLPIVTNTANTQITALATTEFIQNNFSIYPNPATDYLTIKTDTNTDAWYKIIDINGKILLTNKVENRTPININALQSGFYFIIIQTNEGKGTYKFIKN